MALETIIRPPKVGLDFVLAKCGYFTDVQLWPTLTGINTEGWLGNFDVVELDHAVHLLNGFLYYSSALVGELFRSAFHRISRDVINPTQPYVRSEANWRTFQQNVVVTYVTGESPHPSDSGHLFARRARQDLDISEPQIMSPENALETLLANRSLPVVFVDDFVGTGEQFVSTWMREYPMKSGRELSFAEFSRVRGGHFFYCPVVCTTKGRDRILASCPKLRLSPAHLLDEEYSAFHPNSLLWPEHLRHSATAFLNTASKRAGIPVELTRGYKDLGLALAFEHGVPDATIPLFYQNSSAWHPLVNRK